MFLLAKAVYHYIPVSYRKEQANSKEETPNDPLNKPGLQQHSLSVVTASMGSGGLTCEASLFHTLNILPRKNILIYSNIDFSHLKWGL